MHCESEHSCCCQVRDRMHYSKKKKEKINKKQRRNVEEWKECSRGRTQREAQREFSLGVAVTARVFRAALSCKADCTLSKWVWQCVRVYVYVCKSYYVSVLVARQLSFACLRLATRKNVEQNSSGGGRRVGGGGEGRNMVVLIRTRCDATTWRIWSKRGVEGRLLGVLCARFFWLQ